MILHAQLTASSGRRTASRIPPGLGRMVVVVMVAVVVVVMVMVVVVAAVVGG